MKKKSKSVIKKKKEGLKTVQKNIINSNKYEINGLKTVQKDIINSNEYEIKGLKTVQKDNQKAKGVMNVKNLTTILKDLKGK